jgi:hypothetical protein
MIGAQYGLLAQFKLAKKLEEDARKRREEEKEAAEAKDSEEE